MNPLLQQVQISDLELKANTFDNDVTRKIKTNLSFESRFLPGNLTGFLLVFELVPENEANGFLLKLKAVAHFEADAPIDEAFKESSFVKVSAPAIVFPYIRAYVSNLTLNSGYEPIMLPFLQFCKTCRLNRSIAVTTRDTPAT